MIGLRIGPVSLESSSFGVGAVLLAKQIVRYAIFGLVAATILTVLGATQVHAQYAIFRVQEIPWRDCFVWAGIEWYAWALLVPFVALLARYFRFERNQNLPVSILVHVFGAAIFALVHASLQTLGILLLATDNFGLVQNFSGGVVRLLVSQLHWELMSYAMIVAATQFGFYLRRAQSEAMARRESETLAAQTQLAALKRQMQPHFLFNALNAQVAMLEEGSNAQRFTIRLAQMLRIILGSGDRATATLREEIALVNAYLEVERARFGSRLVATIHVPESLYALQLPSLILQPLVENAITHGIGKATEGGDIVVRAYTDPDGATIEVVNTCGKTSENPDAGNGLQITLNNCRRRLALMYGDKARFEAGYLDQSSTFRAAMVLPQSYSGKNLTHEPLHNAGS